MDILPHNFIFGYTCGYAQIFEKIIFNFVINSIQFSSG